jgi:hypothetical protein
MSEENAIVKPAFGSTSIVAGARPSTQGNMGLSKIVMYQGTPEEEMMYGDSFKRGEFLDELEKESFGRSIRIVIVGAWATFAKFVKGQKAPVYSYTGWETVPEHVRPDFEWHDNTPPSGTEIINAIVLRVVDNQALPFPYLIQFKRTSMGAWNGKLGIERHESRFGACLYELSGEDASNAEGKPFKKLTSRMVVKLMPNDPLRIALDECRAQLADLKQQASSIGHDDDLPV